MKVDRLTSLIMRSTWLIDPRVAAMYLPRIASYLNGEKTSFFLDDDEDDDEIAATYFTASGLQMSITKDQAKRGNIFSDAPAGSVAVIPVEGVITKYDNCGAPGTDTMRAWARDAWASENIVGVVPKINSGGGSVFGTPDLHHMLTQIKAYKPVNSATDGMMGSAACWIGLNGNGVYATNETIEVGCIGTCMSFIDNRAALEKAGYKQHYVNADDSIDKNMDFIQALNGDYSGLKLNILNPTNDVFLKTVKQDREGKLKLTEVKLDGKSYYEPLTGKIYLAPAAIENGLIDGIMPFEEVVNLTMEQSFNQKSNFVNHKQSFNMSFFNKHPKLTSAATKARAGEDVSAAELEELNTELNKDGSTGLVILKQSDVEKLESDLVAANAAVNAANTAKATAENNLAATVKERDDWKQKAETYGAQPGAAPSTPEPGAAAEAEQQPGDAAAQAEKEIWNDPKMEFNQMVDRGRTSSKV